MSRRIKKQSIHLLLVGDSAVGKTCLLSRFISDKFNFNLVSTIGLDYKMKEINVDNVPYNLLIWDTAGQERFRTITPSFFRGAHGVAVVYDVSSQESFEHVKFWCDEISFHATTTMHTILIGNKCDVEEKDRQVTTLQGAKLAEEMNIPLFIETSAKENINVNKAFDSLTNEIIVDMQERSIANVENERVIAIEKGTTESLWRRFGCC